MESNSSHDAFYRNSLALNNKKKKKKKEGQNLVLKLRKFWGELEDPNGAYQSASNLQIALLRPKGVILFSSPSQPRWRHNGPNGFLGEMT